MHRFRVAYAKGVVAGCVGGRIKLARSNLVSVIIPCYNYGAFIADTIASLQSQSYENWEAIVVDDGSTDDTGSKVASLARDDARIFYFRQENQGVSVARNTGIAKARGEFVSFLDADDLVTASKLRAHVEHFSRCPSVNISCSSLRYFSDSNPRELFTNYKLDPTRKGDCQIAGRGKEAFPVFVRQNSLPLQAAMFRRSLLQCVGFFDPDMRALEDWDYVLRSILRGACIAGVDDPSAMAMIRVHSSSATQNIEFAEYVDHVYKNVMTEIDRLRVLGHEKDASFYIKHLQEVMLERGRKKSRRVSRERRSEILARIKSSGLGNAGNLWKVVLDYGFMSFIRAYVVAVFTYLSTRR